MKGFIAIAAAVLIGAFWYMSAYNGLVTADQEVSATYAQVQNVLQRRADLIPNLVEVVKGYAKHESEVFEQVAAARAQVGAAIKIDAASLANDPKAQEKLAQASQAMTASLSRLIAVSEAYPELKANQNFLELQAQLEGTENRIAVERRKNQLAVQGFNTRVRTFPTALIAQTSGFTAKPYFAADETAQTAPKVKF